MNEAERRLREVFRNAPIDAPRGPDCPPSERSLEVVRKQVSAADREAFAAHAAICASCTAEWSLARAFAEESDRVSPARAVRLRPWVAVAAAAFLIALVAVLVPRETGPEPAPVFRSGGGSGPASTVPAGASLPRDAFRLKWRDGGRGFRYDLRAFDARLRLLHEERGLIAPEATVPPEALASLAAGAVVLWQVEAIDPEGARIVSETFRAHVAP